MAVTEFASGSLAAPATGLRAPAHLLVTDAEVAFVTANEQAEKPSAMCTAILRLDGSSLHEPAQQS